MSETSGMYCTGSDFCQELSGESDTEFRRVYEDGPLSRVIGRSQNLTLMVDMSPLCVGHLLIVSNRHHLSFAEVVGDHASEVEEFSQRVLERYADTFGTPLILEHGSAREMDGSSCITHAHWHVLPLELDAVHKAMTNDGLACTELGGVDDLAAAGQGVPYFYCADQDRRRLYGIGQTMRRQYLRSVAGALLGIPDPEWDYALMVRKRLFHITREKSEMWRLGT